MKWQEEFKKNVIKFLCNPNQPRDKYGKWTSGGEMGGGGFSTEQIEQSIADWKQGKEYTSFFLHSDLGKSAEFEFSGNDIIQERKKKHAEESYQALNYFIDTVPMYEGKVYKFAHSKKIEIVDDMFSFNTKESWTKNLEGMGTFTQADGYLIEYVSKKGNRNKFVDIHELGLGNFPQEYEVISQKK